MRTADPRVAAKRERAAELEGEGKNASEIAEIMGAKVGTVQRWLQVIRGPKEKAPFKTRVIEMLEDGEDFETIVAEVGCTHENVRKIERGVRSRLSTGYSWREKRVQRYLADPEKEIKKRYARSESFSRDLVAYCHEATVLDPKNAKPILEVGVKHFTTLKSRLRVADKIQAAACNLVQVEAAIAARERALDRPENGLLILQGLIERSSSCVSCVADLVRRESMMLKDLKRFRTALERLQRSKRLYTAMAHDGHDSFRNGLGSCALFESALYYYMGNAQQSVPLAENALKHLVKPTETGLVAMLRFNIAQALLESSDHSDQQRAQEIADELYTLCGAISSVRRLRFTWLSGRAAEQRGNRKLALNRYEDAYDDALELELDRGVGALLADLERLTENPKSLQGRISRLLRMDRGKPPHWLMIAPKLERRLDQIETHFRMPKPVDNQDWYPDLLMSIRLECGGNKFLPLDAAMAATA